MNPKAKGVKKITTEWSCKWFDVIKFKYGVQTHYKVRPPTDGVSAIVVRKDGKFVMVRQRRPFFDSPKLELASGGMEKGETPQQTAIREIFEETGYKVISIKRMVSLSPEPSMEAFNGHCFIARVGNSPESKPTEKDLPDSKVMVMELSSLFKAAKRGKVEWVTLSLLMYYLQFEKPKRK
jgi:ADP-ribose pyrophosphatase